LLTSMPLSYICLITFTQLWVLSGLFDYEKGEDVISSSLYSGSHLFFTSTLTLDNLEKIDNFKLFFSLGKDK
jgi:hypothetical protein